MDGFSSCKLLAVRLNLVNLFWIKGVVKTVEVNGLQTEDKLK